MSEETSTMSKETMDHAQQVSFDIPEVPFDRERSLLTYRGLFQHKEVSFVLQRSLLRPATHDA